MDNTYKVGCRWKIIFVDLDNTLLRSNKEISYYTKKIFEFCKKRKILISFVTARPEAGAKKYIDIIKPDVVILSGGALAKEKNKIIYEKKININTTNNFILDCMNNVDIEEIAVDTAKGYFWNNVCAKSLNKSFSAIFNDFSKPLDLESYKIVIKVNNNFKIDYLLKKYDECNMTSYTGESWKSFSSSQVTKMNTIYSVLKYLDIDLMEAIAFGDDDYDMEMIEKCGLGVAVENATENVKKVSDYITESNEMDGVANFIEKFLL